jgi:hypothetical protein
MSVENSHSDHHFRSVASFQDLVSTPFHENMNAVGWKRNIKGDFTDILNQIEMVGNIMTLNENDLQMLTLNQQGQLARETLLADISALKSIGAQPTLNIIKNYDRDEEFPFFPTDVYSFHVDRSPVPTETYLCTYHGACSEILPNSEAIQKILVPEIRENLIELHDGPKENFETFLEDFFFDLHYQARPNALPLNLGTGNLWKLAVDHPKSDCLPCIHRAPKESDGELRLMLIC